MPVLGLGGPGFACVFDPISDSRRHPNFVNFFRQLVKNDDCSPRFQIRSYSAMLINLLLFLVFVFLFCCSSTPPTFLLSFIFLWFYCLSKNTIHFKFAFCFLFCCTGGNCQCSRVPTLCTTKLVITQMRGLLSVQMYVNTAVLN